MALNRTDKVPLDKDGLRLLGTALFIGQIREQRDILEGIRGNKKFKDLETSGTLKDMPPIDEWQAREDLECPFLTIDDFNPKNPTITGLKENLKKLGPQRGDVEKARLVTLQTFKFEWHYLKKCPNLGVHLKDGLPKKLKKWFPNDLVISGCRMNVVGELTDIWFEEVIRVVDLKEGLVPSSITEDEYLFSLLVSDICGSPSLRGNPEGPRYDDDLVSASEYAGFLVMEHGFKRFAAAKEAVKYFNLLGNSEEAKVERVYSILRDFNFPS